MPAATHRSARESKKQQGIKGMRVLVQHGSILDLLESALHSATQVARYFNGASP
jgi:hypothetical protein